MTMTRLSTLAVVTLAALAAFVSSGSTASAGCHGGYCGPQFYGQACYDNYGYDYGNGYGQYVSYFGQFSLQERLVLVKRFPQFEKAIFPNGIPANGVVGGPAVTGAVAPAVGGPGPAPGGVVAPAVGGAGPVVGAPALKAGPAVAPGPGGAVIPPAPGAAGPVAPVAGPGVAGPAAAPAAVTVNPSEVPVRPELAPIPGSGPAR